MRINSPKSSPTKTIIVLISVLCIVAAGFLYYSHHFQKWPFLPSQPVVQPIKTTSIDYKTPSSDQSTSGTSIKQQAADNQATSQTQNSGSIPVTITSVQPGPVVYIRANIGIVSSSGTCDLSMTSPGGKTYKAAAGIQAMASSSTCKGFNIPMSDLASGSWKITVSVTDGSATGQATTEETL